MVTVQSGSLCTNPSAHQSVTMLGTTYCTLEGGCMQRIITGEGCGPRLDLHLLQGLGASSAQHCWISSSTSGHSEHPDGGLRGQQAFAPVPS